MAKFKEITKGLVNLTLLEGYGLTEGTVFSTATPPFGNKELQDSIGIRIPYQEMEVAALDEKGKTQFDEHGQVVCLGPNQTGTIIIRGPNVFQGYLNENDNENAWVDYPGGWLNTGDLAQKNKNDYFFLIGRKKDLIIRGGHNIDPKLIEEPLSQHPAVAIVAAVGKPDIIKGELPMAFVQLHPNAALSINDLLNYAKDHISEQAAVPHQIEIIQVMPLTSVGKIYKPALRIVAAKQAIEEELFVLKELDIKFDISVNIDNTQRLIATITVEDNIKEEAIKKMQSRLEDYSFKIEFKQKGTRFD